MANGVFRAHRDGTDHPALQGKELASEGAAISTGCMGGSKWNSFGSSFMNAGPSTFPGVGCSQHLRHLRGQKNWLQTQPLN